MALRKVTQVVKTPIVESPLNMLIYSPAGHGKTTFLASGVNDERFWPMIIADFEGGVRSISSKVRYVGLGQLGVTDPIPGKIDVVKIQTWKDFNDLYAYLSGPDNVYKCLGMDSLTEMNYLNLLDVTDDAIKADLKHDPDLSEQRDYLRSQTQMRKLIRFFRDLPLHTVFSAGVGEQEDPRTHKKKSVPALVGKLVNEIPGLVDIIGYLAIVEDEAEGTSTRWLLVQATERFMAKARDEEHRLGSQIEDPTLVKIMDLLEGKVESAQ